MGTSRAKFEETKVRWRRLVGRLELERHTGDSGDYDYLTLERKCRSVDAHHVVADMMTAALAAGAYLTASPVDDVVVIGIHLSCYEAPIPEDELVIETNSLAISDAAWESAWAE